jgi:hypothetical protein
MAGRRSYRNEVKRCRWRSWMCSALNYLLSSVQAFWGSSASTLVVTGSRAHEPIAGRLLWRHGYRLFMLHVTMAQNRSSQLTPSLKQLQFHAAHWSPLHATRSFQPVCAQVFFKETVSGARIVQHLEHKRKAGCDGKLDCLCWDRDKDGSGKGSR